MAKNHRVCKSCGKPIARNHHWWLVETTVFERIYGRVFGKPFEHHEPQHWNCEHPNQHEPTFRGKVRDLPHDEPWNPAELDSPQ